MWLRQISNARSKRQDGERLRGRKRERGVIFLFFFFFFWGVHWPWKMLVGSSIALEEALWELFSLLSQWPSLNRMTEVQVAFLCKQLPCRSVIEQNTVPSNFTWRSVTPDVSVMVMEGGGGEDNTFLFPSWDPHAFISHFLHAGGLKKKTKAETKLLFKSCKNKLRR